MEVSIRRASRGEDVERVAPLFDAYRQFYDKRPDPALALAFIRERVERDESVIFIAEGDPGEGPAGFVQLFPSFSSVEARRIWVLNDLFVAPAWRGRGVGRALMEAARRHAVETGARRLTLETMAGNRAACSLYESLGYVRHAEDARFYTLELE